jgi:hypothetical protein
MQRLITKYSIAFLILLQVTASGQVINKFEYFFDTDPGIGKGGAIAINKPFTDTSFTVSVASLASGLHTFYIRSIDTSGKWSMNNISSFIKYDGIDTVLNIVGLEYFFDKDPGFGKGTAVTVTPGNTISNLFDITVPDNGTNSTTFHLRVKDSYGRWSLLFDTTYNLCEILKAVPNFGFIRYGNQFSLVDSSFNNPNHKLKWVYDDQSAADTIINPVHAFPIGRHFVKLIAGSGCRADSITKGLFAGVESYSPKAILGGADYTVDIYGSGFDPSVTATLNDGSTVINPRSMRFVNASHVVFLFNFHASLSHTVRNLDLAVHFPTAHYDTVIQKAIIYSPYPDFAQHRIPIPP